MLLYSYEEDIEQVSLGSTYHNSFMVIFAGINFLNLKKLGFVFLDAPNSTPRPQL